MRVSRRLALFASLLSLSIPVAIAACSTSTDAGGTPAKPATTGAFRGLLTGPNETGVLDVAIGAAGAAATSRPLASGGATAVTGTITFVGGGGTVSLTGTFDPATGALSFSGTNARGTYALTGTSNASGFAGTYSGPSGSGSFTLSSSASGAVTLYCGTYAGPSGATMGVWDLVVDATGNATGSHCDAKSCGVITGTAQGGSVSMSDPSTGANSATGTIGNGAASGTWTGGNQSGTWSGSTAACQATIDAGAPPQDAGAPQADSGAGDAASLDGGTVTAQTLLTGLTDPVSFAIDGGFLYWMSGADAMVERCALPACSAAQPVVTSLSVPSSVAAANGAIYWTTGFQYVMTCTPPANGTCTGTTFKDLGASAYPAHLWVANTHLYWIAESGQSRLIQTCPLTGCSTGYPKTVLQTSSNTLLYNVAVGGLVVDASSAYVSLFTGGIYRVALTDPETADPATITQLQPSAYTTSELDLDGTTLRWGLGNDGKIAQCTTPDCASVGDFLTGHAAPLTTRSTATDIYGVDRGTQKPGGAFNPQTGSVWVVHR